MTEADKEFLEQEAALRDMSVSQYLRPGLILSIAMHYLGISVDEAVQRLLQEDVPIEEFVEYLAHNEIRTSQLTSLFRQRRKKSE